jgi:hypothetical protein
MFGGNPGPGSYFVVSQNTFDGIHKQDFGLFYDTSDVLLEGNRVINGDLPLLYFSQFVPTASDVREDIEFCWNLYWNEATETLIEGAGGVSIGQGSGAIGNHYGSFWSYRNNLKNPHVSLVGLGAGGPFTFENDFIEHSGAYTNGFYLLSCAVSPTKVSRDASATTSHSQVGSACSIQTSC